MKERPDLPPQGPHKLDEARSEDPVGITPQAPLCSVGLSFDPEEALATDAAFREEFSILRDLTRRYEGHGVRINKYLPRLLRHRWILEWQAASNHELAECKGRQDLVARRRKDILRWLSGPDFLMPYTKPFTAYIPEDLDAPMAHRILRLRDEREWLVLSTKMTKDSRMPWRPVKDVIGHEIVRGLLDWRATHLDAMLSLDFIPGRIRHAGPNADRGGREFVHEVKFDTIVFMVWFFSGWN